MGVRNPKLFCYSILFSLLTLVVGGDESWPIHSGLSRQPRKWYQPEVPSSHLYISNVDLKEAIDVGIKKELHLRASLEPPLLNNEPSTPPSHPEWQSKDRFQRCSAAKSLAKAAFIAEETTVSLSAYVDLMERRDYVNALEWVNVNDTLLGVNCPVRAIERCKPGMYRQFDGHCNNVNHPRWGLACNPYLRFLPPEYSDHIRSPRASSTGLPLPSPVDVVSAFPSEGRSVHPYVSQVAMMWGLMVLGDIARTEPWLGFMCKRVKCCGRPEGSSHPECYAIPVDMPTSSDNGPSTLCIEYVRSSVVPRDGCALGPRQQANWETPFLDGSFLYGASNRENSHSTMHGTGLLYFREREIENPAEVVCPKKEACCLATQFSIGYGTMLPWMRVLWGREHNRVARVLMTLNPSWTDVEVFNESRRIVVAEIQHITYNEFLPLLLGDRVSRFFRVDLNPTSEDYYHDYNMSVAPGTANVVPTVAVAAFWSALVDQLDLRDPITKKKIGQVTFGESQHLPEDVYQEKLLEKLLTGAVQKRILVPTFGYRLVEMSLFPASLGGIDVNAIGIQQGRDHGIPPYTRWRQWCNLEVPKSFKHLDSFMNSPNVSLTFSKLYDSVDDIDLLPAVLSEVAIEGALFGPTLSCIFGHQFRHIRMTDRFWYENDLPPSSFTPLQLRQIRRTSLARIICDNGQKVDYMHPRVMKVPDEWMNIRQSCMDDSVPRMNLKVWQQTRPAGFSERALALVLRKAQETHYTLHYPELPQQMYMVLDSQARNMGLAGATSQALVVSSQSSSLEHFTRTVIADVKPTLTATRTRDLAVDLEKISLSYFTNDFEEPEVSGENLDICDPTAPYRSYSGRCNNLRNSSYGQATSSLLRMLPAHYEDGISAPRRKEEGGGRMPSPILVARLLHGSDDNSQPHPRYTALLLHFGHFVAHDLSYTPVRQGPNREMLECSPCDSHITTHHECLPLAPSPEDLKSERDMNECQSFTRSIPGQRTLGPRQQINQATAFLDASTLYGWDRCTADSLRTRSGGMIYMLQKEFQSAMHLSAYSTCDDPYIGFCLPEVEHLGLLLLLTLFSREHNRIAAELHRINPMWTDERLYQESRRIVIATLQNIAYRELLPRVVGLDHFQRFVNVPEAGVYGTYDDSCDPGILNEFATAAFRFGDTLLPVLERPNGLPDDFGEKVTPEEWAFDSLLQKLLSTPPQWYDVHVNKTAARMRFTRSVPMSPGQTVAADLIQRGRDHGLAPYNEYRDICGSLAVATFFDINDIDRETVMMLTSVYGRPGDVDLFIGGISENVVEGGLVGPTFACIIVEQFAKLRRCDRFFYDTDDPIVRFSPQQLASLKSVTLSKVICDNSRISSIPRQGMDVYDPYANPLLTCSELPSVDLNLWKESTFCKVKQREFDVGHSTRVSPCVRCLCTKDGPVCRSLKVTNCAALLKRFRDSELAEDVVCVVQCGHMMNVRRLETNSD